MDPEGVTPPDKVAVSLTSPPSTLTDGEAVVTRVGVTSPAVTTTRSPVLAQIPLAGKLLASPLYSAIHW